MDKPEALEELKPCPFCGGPVSLEEAHIQRTKMYGARQFYGVVCRNITNLGGSCCMEQVPSASKKAAVSRWNMRNGIKEGGIMSKPEALRLADETVAISDPTVSKMYVPQRQILVNAAHELSRLHAENERLKAELEIERGRLAACGVAALGYFEGCKDEYKSASLDYVLRIRSENEQLKADLRELVSALELAVNLGMKLDLSGKVPVVILNICGTESHFYESNSNKTKSICRAIVRAAAEIGAKNE